MIYGIIMSGGRGTRLKSNVEKPLFKLHNKPLIKYVLDNINGSKSIDQAFIATSPHTPNTKEYLNNENIIDTPGNSYVEDLSYILSNFEEKSKNDSLLFINADLPFISSEIIDDVIESYFKYNVDSLSVMVPVSTFEKLGLKYSYDFNGLVPSGLNVLRSENIVQDEKIHVLDNEELAFNINTLKDASVATNNFNKFLK